jgi:broad specificity phosphatase PhoE
VVHLLRHGEVHNPQGVLYGRLPGYRLSDRGHAMAQRVADVLGSRDVALVVASPLERAQQTAAPLAGRLGLPVATDTRLVEADNAFQGKAFGVGDGSLRHPQAWWLLRNPFRPSWGEPYDVLAARMLAAVEDAAAAAQGHEAVLVSHQLPIWTARCAAQGRRLWHDPRQRQCSLASLTSLQYRDGRLRAVSYSEPARDLLPQHQQAGA